MKKIYSSILFLFFVTNFFATDLVVNSSGQPGTYTTLSAALSAAASSGDRILIPSTITLIEDITINKSIDIMPQTQGNYFYLEGDINVTANAGTEIRILGMNYSGNLVCSSGTAVETNRCDLYFIDCNITDPGTTELNANVIGLGFHVLYCNIPDTDVIFQFGEIIGSHLNNFRVLFTDNNNYNDTIKIIANILESLTKTSITSSVQNTTFVFSSYDNSSHYFKIANNFFKHSASTENYSKLTIFSSNNSANGTNDISNNTIASSTGCNAVYPSGVCLLFDNCGMTWPRNKTYVYNNIFLGGRYYNESYIIGFKCSPGPGEELPIVKYNVFSSSLGSGCGTDNESNAVDYWPVNSSGYFDASFTIDPNNYTVQSAINDNSAQISNSSGKGIGGVTTNSGKNDVTYYDLDMTRNDLGTYGGPFSMENYWDSTATGKARIYHLDMPSEIWSGQTPTIKASAVHKK